jgi:large subunit ribosomal protein L22
MAGVEVRAVAKQIRISPQKVRLVLDVIRGKPVSEALALLRYMPHKATGPVSKVLKSASANDEGRTLKRWRPRARGRVNQILKRSSHITVVVSEKGT